MPFNKFAGAGFAVLIAFAAVPSADAHEDEFAFGMPGSAAKVSRTVKIEMGDLSFQPSLVSVKPGETVRFVITNTSGIDHDFTLGDAKTQAAHRKEMAEMADMASMGHDMAQMHDAMGGGDPNAVFVKAGATKELTWTFGNAMQVEYDCNVPGHYEAGMKGTITVK